MSLQARQTLKKYWGYESFRPMQEEIVDTALGGSDVLCILPTGGGKSICFQVPAMMREGLAIVVTPLIALMKDQVQNLEKRGIKALSIHAGMSRREIDLALNNAAYGDVKFLYVSPERLGTELFRSYLEVMRVNFIVVDEAHCVSQWGYDFRPDYLKINQIRELCDAPLIALTATATPSVAEDIIARLRKDGRDFKMLRSGFERLNLSYIVRKCSDTAGQALDICRSVAGSGIIYLRHRRKCEEVAALLRAGGVSASFYHAGLGSETRTLRQQQWKSGELRVMVCTNAFGMGIDKPDVRFVVHMSLPDSLEAYFQEAGRAGRDGLRSFAVLLWNEGDLRGIDRLLQLSYPSLEYIEDIYQKIHIFAGLQYESGAGRQLKFDLEEFCRRYKLQRAQTFYAIKSLERSSHLAFCEDIEISTQVQIRVQRNSLYEIDLPEPGMVSLLEALMRSYPGIFNYPVPVSEDKLSVACGLTVAGLRQMLYRLSIEHVIKYIPCDRSTVICLHHNRLMPGNIDLQPKVHEFLKQTAVSRADAIKNYVTEEDECRSQVLLRYFGQQESEPCGTCDVCRGTRGGGAAHTASEEATRDALLSFVASHPDCSAEELAAFCSDPSLGPGAMKLYRQMLDDGTICR